LNSRLVAAETCAALTTQHRFSSPSPQSHQDSACTICDCGRHSVICHPVSVTLIATQLAGFKVLRTENHSETKRLYITLTKELTNVYGSLPRGHVSPAGELPSFASYQQQCVEGRKVTMSDMWGRMLCSVPSALPHLPCPTHNSVRSTSCVFPHHIACLCER
jgi:hypothetical protein